MLTRIKNFGVILFIAFTNQFGKNFTFQKTFISESLPIA